MPPRLTAPLRGLRGVSESEYVCPSCMLRNVHRIRTLVVRRQIQETRCATLSRSFSAVHSERILSGQNFSRKGRIPTIITSHKRRSSNVSLASATAINAPSTVPAAYRDLHQRLHHLQEEAGSYVNLSRLQLAARSLESNDPVVRVAFLGLGAKGTLAARKLARAILSDALGPKEQWEEELIEFGRDGRSLLLKYGEPDDVVPHSVLVHEMRIPSQFLKRNRIEILVTTLNISGTPANHINDVDFEEALLVPSLTTPSSNGGRVGFVRYPVHKAVLVADGIMGAIEYGRLPRSIDHSALINSALSLPLRITSGNNSVEEEAIGNVVDIDLALHALDLFRASNANGARYSEEWQASRIPVLSDRITASQISSGGGMNTAIRSLLDSILLKASACVDQSESEQIKAIENATVPDTKRRELMQVISAWSEDAHRDLQTNLNTAVTSPVWRRTAWWRLIWRIDDVSVSAGDVLQLSWLTEAEQSLAFLSGRIAEAGLATPDELKDQDASARVFESDIAATASSWDPSEPKKAQILNMTDLLQTQSLVARVKHQSGINAVFDPPWPQAIHLSRQQLLHTVVPDLHRKAQGLLVSTLSTAGGATALGLWLSIATTDIYGGGAVAALGLVWGLRRLQKIWGKERDGFVNSLREDGRKVLAAVESHLRKLVDQGGREDVSPEDRESWCKARSAIMNCREALEKIK